MRIRLVVDKTGLRWDGQDWPPHGGEINVPDDEGAALCAQGDAVPVAQPDAPAETPESALEAATELRGQEPAPPSARASRGDWAAYAIARGMDSGEAEAMTKADLINRLKEG